jgi:hypothetical protein
MLIEFRIKVSILTFHSYVAILNHIFRLKIVHKSHTARTEPSRAFRGSILS